MIEQTTPPTVSDADRAHANFILNKWWPDAQIGEEHQYRPVIGEWDAPTDWILTASGWEPVTYVKTVQRIQVVGPAPSSLKESVTP
jgi:hypothetical protein